MSDTPEDHEDRIARIERTLYGGDDSSTGLSARMRTTEHSLTNIEDGIKRLIWLVITAIIVAVLGLVVRPVQLPASVKTWLTTADVAAREKLTERTVEN